MRILAALCIVSLATGCATILTDEEAAPCEGDESCLVKTLEEKVVQKEFEREHRRAVDLDNYLMCVKIYKSSSVPMVHVNHRHGKRDRIRYWDIKDDLMHNNCRSIMNRETWAKY